MAHRVLPSGLIDDLRLGGTAHRGEIADVLLGVAVLQIPRSGVIVLMPVISSVIRKGDLVVVSEQRLVTGCVDWSLWGVRKLDL